MRRPWQATIPIGPRRSLSQDALCRQSCCSRPALRRCLACATRPGLRPRICSRSLPAYRAPSPVGARGRAARAATAHRPVARDRGFRSPALAYFLHDEAMGKSGARSSGPMGLSVPGCNGGAMGSGRSPAMLYQARGMRSCGRLNWTGFMGAILPIEAHPNERPLV